MKRIIHDGCMFFLAAAVGLYLAACTVSGVSNVSQNGDSASARSAKLTSVLAQLPGIIRALTTIVTASPLESDIKTKLTTILADASTAVSAASSTGDGNKLQSVATAISLVTATITSSSLVDASTKAVVSGYGTWAIVILETINIVASGV